MSDVCLGTTPDASASRDAIHVAVIPQIADRVLKPGEHMQYGIVDPYRIDYVKEGERYWLCLYQGIVTGMRHHWSHPAFKDGPQFSIPQTSSEEWLRWFAEEAGLSYGMLIEHVTDYVQSGGEPWVEQGRQTAQDAYNSLSDKGEFWRHFENVTGVAEPVNPRWYMPFSCSC